MGYTAVSVLYIIHSFYLCLAPYDFQTVCSVFVSPSNFYAMLLCVFLSTVIVVMLIDSCKVDNQPFCLYRWMQLFVCHIFLHIIEFQIDFWIWVCFKSFRFLLMRIGIESFLFPFAIEPFQLLSHSKVVNRFPSELVLILHFNFAENPFTESDFQIFESLLLQNPFQLFHSLFHLKTCETHVHFKLHRIWLFLCRKWV